MSEARLLHFVSLGGPGGAERHCMEFLAQAGAVEPRWRHGLLVAGKRMHADLEAGLDRRQLVGHEKYAGPVKLPSVPAGLRRRHMRRCVGGWAPDVVLIWNRPGRARMLLEAVAPPRWMHWEHGAAWLPEPGSESIKREFYRLCPRIIANSEATRRVLALRWERETGVEVCPNALRPSLLPNAPVEPKRLAARPLRLGLAGRLVPVKGGALALQALATLLGRGVDVELHIAGDGECRAELVQLARRLGNAPRIVWHGQLADMSPFYARIDCLVQPSVHESYGLVCLEAAAHACPVVASAVDGLPELVHAGVSGFTVVPELPVWEYADLGGSLSDMPEFVYDPRSDRLAEPKLVSPASLADAVEGLLVPGRLAALSAGAVERLRERFDFRAHVAAVMNAVERYRDEQPARAG